MMRSVTKAMPIQFIDGRSHIKKRRGCKTTLSGYYTCPSCDLLLMLSGAHTHIHQRSWTKRFQETRHIRAAGLHTPGLKRGIGIESEKYANKLEMKKVWKHVKDEAQ